MINNDAVGREAGEGGYAFLLYTHVDFARSGEELYASDFSEPEDRRRDSPEGQQQLYVGTIYLAGQPALRDLWATNRWSTPSVSSRSSEFEVLILATIDRSL